MEPQLDNLEREINRALDGELPGDDRLALDRELIRRPELRAMMERSARIDDLAGAALRGLFDDTGAPHLTLPDAPARRHRRGYHRAWWLMPGAAAAAVLAGLLFFAKPPERLASVTQNDGGSRSQPIGTLSDLMNAEGFPTQAAYQPARIDRHLGRDVFGVLGTDGNVYLIETDHTRTVNQPGGGWQSLPVGGDL